VRVDALQDGQLPQVATDALGVEDLWNEAAIRQRGRITEAAAAAGALPMQHLFDGIQPERDPVLRPSLPLNAIQAARLQIFQHAQITERMNVAGHRQRQCPDARALRTGAW